MHRTRVRVFDNIGINAHAHSTYVFTETDTVVYILYICAFHAKAIMKLGFLSQPLIYMSNIEIFSIAYVKKHMNYFQNDIVHIRYTIEN